jgi:hypothetical protein
VLDVDGQYSFEVAAVADQQPVQAFGSDRADPVFGVGVRLRRPAGRIDQKSPAPHIFTRPHDAIESPARLLSAVDAR